MTFFRLFISELVQLSNPNDLEKTIFIFPEGALSNVYLEGNEIEFRIEFLKKIFFILLFPLN